MVLPRKSTLTRRSPCNGSKILPAMSATMSRSSSKQIAVTFLLLSLSLLLILNWYGILFITVSSMDKQSTTINTTTAVLNDEIQLLGTVTDSTQHQHLHLHPQQQQQQQQQQQPYPQSSWTSTTASNSIKNNTIAYAISLIKCGDHQTTATGLTDAALILRHSIHLISSRTPSSQSKYDYHMVALVHRQALPCSHVLKQAGFEIMVVDPPIKPSEIQGEFLRKKIHTAWCCGHDEFIKWYPYTMTSYPAVVHVDIDFAFFKPMDDLLDAMIHPANSDLGRAARQRIQRERKQEPLPDRIDAYFTRDWPQVIPGRVAGYQAGFIMIRPDPTVFQELTAIVQKGDYVSGHSRSNGWGGLGYGGFVGAMAMQGLMAYYYDHVRPGTAVELNQCRYNWMGMDVRYRAPPNFNPKHAKVGKCRNDKDSCEDCMVTPLEDIYSVHYTQCRKPWNCVGVGVPGGARGSAIDTNAGSYEKCMQVVSKWHSLRRDFETKLYALSLDDRLLQAATQTYMVEVFQGHCEGEGGKNYSKIDASEDTLALVPKLYT